MVRIEELDAHVTHQEQLQDDSDTPVVLVNIFHVDPERADDLQAVWGDVLRRFKGGPGFISAQLHRGTSGSGTFLVYSIWESAASYRAVFEDPAFRGAIGDYPDGSVATPHLFHRVAVKDVCLA